MLYVKEFQNYLKLRICLLYHVNMLKPFIIYLKRPLTSEEKALNQAAQQKRIKETKRIAECLKWRDFEKKKECFVLDELPPVDAWTSFRLRNTDISMFNVFRNFVNDDIIDRLGQRFSEENHTYGSRKGTLKLKRAVITNVKIWQYFAVYIWLVGKQIKAQENTSNLNHLKSRVEVARKYFHEQHGIAAPGRDVIEKLISHCIITYDYAEVISKNFQSLVLKLGQAVAGDEKLFHFTGNSADIRLIPSKPGRVGLWFYELCARLRVGDKELPYLLSYSLQTSQNTDSTVASVVGKWMNALRTIGADRVPEGEHPNPKTYLAFDSFYLSKDSRNMLLAEGQKFTCSVAKERVSLEVSRVHDDQQPDIPGKTRTIVNDESGELFTYHYDRQKGVGKKYNLSYGFIRSELKEKIKAHEEIIPGYSYYKTFFEYCDNFNRSLHDRSWPHKRGGRGQLGDLGVQHDFIMAAILRNTINAYFSITQVDPLSVDFETSMTRLANDIYAYSIQLDSSKILSY